MTDLIQPSTPADGHVKIVAVPVIADTDNPTAAEVNAGAAVDLSCYFTGDGWAPGLDEGVISDDRICTTDTLEQRGRRGRTLATTYIDNTNNPGYANAAVQTLVPGTRTHFVTRRGKAFDSPMAAGDVVDVWTVEAGEYNEVAPDANSVLKTQQKMFVVQPMKPRRTLA